MKRIYALLILLGMLSALLTGCTIAQPQSAMQDDLLQVHFLDVGQADCIFLACGGQTMLIDGGNVDDSDYVVSYLLEQ